MDAEDPTRRGATARLAAVFGAAALAIPGGMLVSNALAADGSTSATDATVVPIQQSEDPGAPAQSERGGRDCPEEEGATQGQGDSGESAAPSTDSGARQTAL